VNPHLRFAQDDNDLGGDENVGTAGIKTIWVGMRTWERLFLGLKMKKRLSALGVFELFRVWHDFGFCQGVLGEIKSLVEFLRAVRRASRD
jgi:hypothetical protein